jgi:hypothetical protein
MRLSSKTAVNLVGFCLAVYFATCVRASTFVMASDDDLIVGARAIVRGKVLSISCQIDDQSERIFTYVRVRVKEVLKGQITDRQIVLKEEGGQVGTRGSTVFGAARFTEGERVLLYLDTRRDGSLRVHQMFMGKFSIIDDSVTGERLVVRDAAERDTSVIQTEGAAGSVTTNRMALETYLDMVRMRIAVNRDRSARFHQRYYQDVPMLAQPREYRAPTAEEIAPQFRFITSPPVRWFEPDDGQPVPFLVNPDGAPTPQIMDDVSAAMEAWSNVPGCSMRVTNGGPTSFCYSRDLNTIVFNNCEGQFAPTPGCASILALGGLNWDSSQTRVINGTTFVRASSGHVSFNPYASCDFEDHCIVREIATHELGHALGLGHSQLADATMAGTAHFDGRCASIRQDDRDGITFMYPIGAGAPGPLTILTTSPVGTATTGSAFSRQLIASGGRTPYTWSLISGSLPEGISLTVAGIISGTASVTGTFEFTVRVTDAQQATAEKALALTVSEPPSGYDSQFVSQNVAATLKPGQIFFTTIRWTNTGSKQWDGGGGFDIRSQNPEGNTIWGGNAVPWFGPPVKPGEQMELVFQANAPANPGTYNFQWQLHQSAIGYFGEMSANVSVTVGDGSMPSIGSPASVSAVRGAFFTHTPTATGGVPPYAWRIAAGTLPPGVNLNPNSGALVGTPSATGTFAVTLQLSDSKNQIAQKGLSITVSEPPLGVTTTTLPPAVKGTSYSQQLSAAGGKPPYSWAVTGGALPGGLTLAGSTGIISGTPSATGSFSFTVTATDAASATASKTLAINVAPPPLSIASVPPLETLMGSPFSYQLVASGGSPPYLWLVSTGSLPPGLTLSGSGMISGAATAAGTFSVAATVRDQGSLSSNVAIQIKVIDPDTIPSIRKVKYKSHKKLVVFGERVNAAAALLVDGNHTSAVADAGSFVLKIQLSSGQHEIRIVNPGGVSSQPFSLTVD